MLLSAARRRVGSVLRPRDNDTPNEPCKKPAVPRSAIGSRPDGSRPRRRQMKLPVRSAFLWLTFACAALVAGCVVFYQNGVEAAGPVEGSRAGYRVLAPIESGNLLLFPVVEAGRMPGAPFITLDEGIKSGQVEVTEAGKVRGLVRPRPAQVPYEGPVNGGVVHPPSPQYRGDQVNTLVLVNNSDKPLLLLAGEIVTGGKQDRVIAKDRIVPVGADPIDLSVFCIEPGRWTESSATFGAAAKAPGQGFMVQPAVRQRAMVDKDQ